MPVWAQSSRAATLPAAQSLPDELARALKNKQALIVMVSLEGCVFCRQARQSHLTPMALSGTVIVQVDMRSSQAVLDFAGKLTTHVGSMQKTDIDALHAAGCDDGEILEVNQVCAYFNYSNRLLNGLGVSTQGDVIGYYKEQPAGH
jgi:uncharacterized peroxidase-related enzyme